MNRNVKDTIVEGITGFSVLLIIFIIVSILAITIVGGWPNLNWTFLSEFPKDGMTKGGIFPAIVGTALMTIIMAIAAVPFGVITAIYLAEYANEKSIIAKTIRFAVKTLAVVPSIIFGLFGLGFFIGFIGKNMDTLMNGGELRWGQPNILWASFTMALLTLPVVIVSVEEAIRTIPREMREASLALGSNQMADNQKGCFARFSFRNSYRYNSGSKPWCRRSCSYFVYRSCIFPFKSASFIERSVYVARISYLYYVDTIIKCGCNTANSVCNNTGAVAAYIFTECSCSYNKIQNKKKSEIIFFHERY